MNYLWMFYLILILCDVYYSECEEGTIKAMSPQEQFIQQFTRLFHHYTEALFPAEERQAVKEDGSRVESNRLVEAARLVILELESNARLQGDQRRYFAKPGEAEWGC